MFQQMDTLSPKEIEVMRLAFVTAWKFVEVDATLDTLNTADRRKLLLQSVLSVFSGGERDIVPMANGAIALVRNVLTGSPHVRARARAA
jgi:ABC-type iron transport system FetAB ATPase subunit